MKLKENSLNTRLYKWFYVAETLPENLCPYFWKLVVMWLVIVPYSVISMPVIVKDKVSPGDEVDSTMARLLLGSVLYVILLILISMIVALIGLFVSYGDNTLWYKIFGIGFGFWMGAIGFSIYGLIKYIYEKIKDKRFGKKYRDNTPKTKIDSLIIGFIKAKYNKYCPKIDWIK